jgi:D-serine deaminase-like pyridoxal phosphate-dependent protein
VAAGFAARLRHAGIPVPEVSIGSTPTMSLAENLDGITEARPGNYVFYDAFQAAIGSCTLEDCAFSVLTTVVGHYPSQNKIIVDAGALALSKDPGPRHVDADCGFGAVFTADGQRHLPELRVVSLSQEHGQLRGVRPLRLPDYPVGSRLRIVPNHSCLAAAQHDRYHVVAGGRVTETWRPVRGW